MTGHRPEPREERFGEGPEEDGEVVVWTKSSGESSEGTRYSRRTEAGPLRTRRGIPARRAYDLREVVETGGGPSPDSRVSRPSGPHLLGGQIESTDVFQTGHNPRGMSKNSLKKTSSCEVFRWTEPAPSEV